MAVAFVQSVSKKWFGGSGLTETITFPGATSAGHLIPVFVAWSAGSGASIVSVSDGTNTYTPVRTNTNGTTGRSATYYVKNTGSGTFTITVTWGADPGFGFLCAHDVSGADTVAPLDQEIIALSIAPGVGANAITSTAKTTTAPGEYIFGAAFDEGGGATFTAGTGFGIRETQGGVGASEDQIQAAAGSIAATFTQSGDNFGTYHAGLMTFLAAGGAAAQVPYQPAYQQAPVMAQ